MSMLTVLEQEFSEEEIKRYNLLSFARTLSDERLKKAQSFLYSQQCVFNRLCREEVRLLSDYARKESVRIAFMKGVILAEDIYEDPAKRSFSDLDILVHPDDLKTVLTFCKKAGYRSKELDDFDSIDESIRRYLRDYMHHFPIITKTVSVQGVPFTITLELHTYVYIQSFHQTAVPYRETTTSVLSQVVPCWLAGYETVWALHPRDEFLAMILHTAKHFFYSVLEGICFTQNPHYMNFRQLLDIDLYWEKHRMDIGFEALCARAVEWDVVPELTFIFKMLEQYRPGRYFSEELQELYETHRRSKGFVAFAIEHLLGEDLKRIATSSGWEVAKELVDHLVIDYPFVNGHRGEAYPEDPQAIFTIDEFQKPIHNHFGTHYMRNRQPSDSEDWRGKGAVRCDDEFIFFRLEAEDDEFIIEDGAPHEETGVDCLELFFVNFKAQPFHSFIRYLDVHLCMDGAPHSPTYQTPFIYVREFDKATGEWNRWDTDLYTYTFSVDGNTYALELGIRRSVLADCIRDNALYWDMQVNDCDRKPPDYQCKLAWASTMVYCGLQDVSSFGRLQFMEP